MVLNLKLWLLFDSGQELAVAELRQWHKTGRAENMERVTLLREQAGHLLPYFLSEAGCKAKK